MYIFLVCICKDNHLAGINYTILSFRTEGTSCLYSGLLPDLQRQMTFSAIRIGIYDLVKLKYQHLTGVERDQGLRMVGVRVTGGDTMGTLAIHVAQPINVVKVMSLTCSI